MTTNGRRDQSRVDQSVRRPAGWSEQREENRGKKKANRAGLAISSVVQTDSTLKAASCHQYNRVTPSATSPESTIRVHIRLRGQLNLSTFPSDGRGVPVIQPSAVPSKATAVSLSFFSVCFCLLAHSLILLQKGEWLLSVCVCDGLGGG